VKIAVCVLSAVMIIQYNGMTIKNPMPLAKT
jgi:hypothetical protein